MDWARRHLDLTEESPGAVTREGEKQRKRPMGRNPAQETEKAEQAQ